jgi:Uma2 family endonuclease
MMSQAEQLELHYWIAPAVDAWVLPEEKVPESRDHDLLARYLVSVLEASIAARGIDAIIGHNLAVRWIESAPRVGVDPDVCWIEPAPPSGDRLTSLCTWKAGRAVPRLAIEVVSQHHPYKDYVDVQEKYAACGVPELWVIDAELRGPRHLGGPVPLQVWRRDDAGAYVRVHASGEAYHCAELDAWVRVADKTARISDDAAGRKPWLTREETAEARVRELEAKLAGKP